MQTPLKVGACARELGTTCKAIRQALAEIKAIHQDANLTWCTTKHGRDLQLVIDDSGLYWHPGVRGYRHYSVLKITPKGQQWLKQKLTANAA